MGIGSNMIVALKKTHAQALSDYLKSDKKNDCFKIMLNCEDRVWSFSNCGLSIYEFSVFKLLVRNRKQASRQKFL